MSRYVKYWPVQPKCFVNLLPDASQEGRKAGRNPLRERLHKVLGLAAYKARHSVISDCDVRHLLDAWEGSGVAQSTTRHVGSGVSWHSCEHVPAGCGGT